MCRTRKIVGSVKCVKVTGLEGFRPVSWQRRPLLRLFLQDLRVLFTLGPRQTLRCQQLGSATLRWFVSLPRSAFGQVLIQEARALRSVIPATRTGKGPGTAVVRGGPEWGGFLGGVVCVAGMCVGDLACGADADGVPDALDAVLLADALVGIEDDVHFPTAGFKEALYLLRRLRLVHGDEADLRGVKGAHLRDHVRQRFHARSAPRCPKVEHDDFAVLFGAIEVASAKQREAEDRRVFAQHGRSGATPPRQHGPRGSARDTIAEDGRPV